MAPGNVFLDTNVLLHHAYPNIGSDPPEINRQKFEACRQQLIQFQNDDVSLWINGQVIREFWKNASTVKTDGKEIPLANVREKLDEFLRIVTIADNTDAVREQLLVLLDAYTIRGRAIYDANIVATMLAHNIGTVCTLDNDFERYRRRITIVSPLTGTV